MYTKDIKEWSILLKSVRNFIWPYSEIGLKCMYLCPVHSQVLKTLGVALRLPATSQSGSNESLAKDPTPASTARESLYPRPATSVWVSYTHTYFKHSYIYNSFSFLVILYSTAHASLANPRVESRLIYTWITTEEHVLNLQVLDPWSSAENSISGSCQSLDSNSERSELLLQSQKHQQFPPEVEKLLN